MARAEKLDRSLWYRKQNAYKILDREARTLYVQLRPEAKSQEAALKSILASVDSEDLTAQEIEQRVRDKAREWDRDSTRLKSEHLLDSTPELDLAKKLETAVATYKRQQALVADAQKAMKTDDSHVNAQKLKLCMGALTDIQGQVDRYEAALRSRTEQADVDTWKRVQRELMIQYKRQYVGKGPHFTAMIRVAVTSEIRMRQLEEAGQSNSADHEKAARMLLDAIAGLQKYTEAQKTENYTKEIQQVAVVILEIVEANLQTQPMIYSRIVNQVTERITEASAA